MSDPMLPESSVAVDPTRRRADLRHDLVSPLSQILGYSDVLLEELATTGSAEMMRVLRALKGCGREALGTLNTIFPPERIYTGVDFSALATGLEPVLEQIVGLARALEGEAQASQDPGLITDSRRVVAGARGMLELTHELGTGRHA